MKERKDKIVSRLFMKKLELLLEKEKNHLYKCAYCNKLFTMSFTQAVDGPTKNHGVFRADHFQGQKI